MNKKKKQEEKEMLAKMTNYDRKKYLRNKKAKEEKRKTIIYSIITVVCVVAMVGLVVGAKYSQKKLNYQTVATVGDYEVNTLEYDFYCNMYTNSWINNNYYYLSYYGLDLEKPLDEQYYDEKNKVTWMDYFKKESETMMGSVFSIYADAKKADFKDYEDVYEEFIATMKENAKTNEMSYEQYIKAAYGASLSKKEFEEIAKRYCMVTAYDEGLYEKYEAAVTNDRIEEHYKGNKDSYDTVNYMIYTLHLDLKENEKATEEQLSNLEKDATNSLVAVTDKGKDAFIAEAKKHFHEHDGEFSEEAITKKSVGKDSTDSLYSKWLFDASRKEGDVMNVCTQDEQTYYIIYYIGRNLNTEKTVNFRVIAEQWAEKKDSTETTESTENKEEVKVLTKEEAKEKIQKIADDYVLDGANEATFVKLAEENGDASGGLNQYVEKSNMTDEKIANWLFDEKRKENDIKVIESDNYIYLLYFDGFDVPYYQVSIKNTLAQNDYNAYIEGISKDFVAVGSEKTENQDDATTEIKQENVSTETTETKEETTQKETEIKTGDK